MKEIVKKLQDSLEYEFNLSFNERKQLLEEIERLNKQIEEYQKALDEAMSEKIDLENIKKEAIEYLKEKAIYDVDMKEFCRDLYYYNCLELLNILEGVKND